MRAYDEDRSKKLAFELHLRVQSALQTESSAVLDGLSEADRGRIIEERRRRDRIRNELFQVPPFGLMNVFSSMVDSAGWFAVSQIQIYFAHAIRSCDDRFLSNCNSWALDKANTLYRSYLGHLRGIGEDIERFWNINSAGRPGAFRLFDTEPTSFEEFADQIATSPPLKDVTTPVFSCSSERPKPWELHEAFAVSCAYALWYKRKGL